MSISFACPECTHTLSVKDELAGRRGKCPKCQQTIIVPQASAVPASSVALGPTIPTTATSAVGSSAADAPTAAAPHGRHAGAALPPQSPATEKVQAQLATPQPVPATAAPAPSPQQIYQQVMGSFRGTFAPQPTTLMYRLGVLLTTAFMILLPLIYISLIAGVAWLVYWHMANNHVILGSARGRAGFFVLLVYLAPLIVGGILVVFMIKPLFSWGTSDSRTRSINRDSDPLLFAFVDRICEVVHSPKPSRIDIDCDINASARFDNLSGIFSNRLVLTIGMPLAAAMSLQQLAGVLAHEFGHFSQGTGMRLTYVIRTINHWFLRVVYERDSWDQWLASSASEFDLRISWVLYLAMLFVWLTRKVLWVLMMAGHLVAGFMLRQMEFDADTYEARLAGSHTFGQTARQLQVLGIAWQGAQSDLTTFHREGRLADNLPKLIMANVRQLPKEVREFVEKNIVEGKTGWFDSHPCDRERVAAAEALSAPGVFHCNLPAWMIFRNFDETSRGVTWDFYCSIFGTGFKPQDMHSVDELLAKQEIETTYNQTLKRFYGGRFGALRPLRLPSANLQQVVNLDAVVQRLAQCRAVLERDVAAYVQLYKQYDDFDSQLVHALQMYPLVACEIRVKPPEDRAHYRSSREASDARERARTELAKLADRFAGFEQAMGERLYIGLCLVFDDRVGQRIENVDALRRQAEQLLPLVDRVSSHMESLLTVRNHQAVLAALFAHIDGNQSNSRLIQEIQDYNGRLHGQVRDLWELFRHTDYPFDHAKGPMTVSAYLIKTLPPVDEIGMVYDAGESLLSNLMSLYCRALARLCETAEAVERSLGYSPLPQVEEKEAG